jgi:hypothetical protein
MLPKVSQTLYHRDKSYRHAQNGRILIDLGVQRDMSGVPWPQQHWWLQNQAKWVWLQQSTVTGVSGDLRLAVETERVSCRIPRSAVKLDMQTNTKMNAIQYTCCDIHYHFSMPRLHSVLPVNTTDVMVNCRHNIVTQCLWLATKSQWSHEFIMLPSTCSVQTTDATWPQPLPRIQSVKYLISILFIGLCLLGLSYPEFTE